MPSLLQGSDKWNSELGDKNKNTTGSHRRTRQRQDILSKLTKHNQTPNFGLSRGTHNKLVTIVRVWCATVCSEHSTGFTIPYYYSIQGTFLPTHFSDRTTETLGAPRSHCLYAREPGHEPKAVRPQRLHSTGPSGISASRPPTSTTRRSKSVVFPGTGLSAPIPRKQNNTSLAASPQGARQA